MKTAYLFIFLNILLAFNLFAQNTAPTFTSIPDTVAYVDSTYSYKINTSDMENDSISHTATTIPSWLSFHSDAVSTLAGSGSKGDIDGNGKSASFSRSIGVAVDGSGNVYVADGGNHKIRKITPSGGVSTLAGSGLRGDVDSIGSIASFAVPIGVAVDDSGNVYVADIWNHKIRKISPQGVVSTFAGSGTKGSADGTGSAASFDEPAGVAVDDSGNVYVADRGNRKIRKITPLGVVSTLAGSGSYGSTDGTSSTASFRNTSGVTVDDSGNVYVADRNNHKIRKITPLGLVSTLAGSGNSGDVDGVSNSASFSFPDGVAADSSGNVYVADAGNDKIRKITPLGVVSTLAGNGSEGDIDGAGSFASFNYPTGVAIDSSGNVYVADRDNYKIRKIVLGPQLAGTPSTVNIGKHAVALSATDSNASSMQSFNVNVVALPSVNITATHVSCDGFSDGRLDATVSGGIPPYNYLWSSLTDSTLSSTDSIVNLVVGIYTVTIVDDRGVISTASATVKQPTVLIAVDNVESFAGASDAGATASVINGMMPYTYSWSNLDTTASISGVEAGTYSVTITDGNGCTVKDSVIIVANTAPAFTSTPDTVVYVDSTYFYEINTSNVENDFIITTATTVPPWLIFSIGAEVNTLAGSGSEGDIDSTDSFASFYAPNGVAVDGSGNVYVADTYNHKIRKISPSGVVSTLAGSGSRGNIDGNSGSASFDQPAGVTIDGSGNVYVADRNNHKIRKITSSGMVSTLAGIGNSGDVDSVGSFASFNRPSGVSVDGNGNIYVADAGNHKIRKISSLGVVSTFAGSGSRDSTDGSGSAASFNEPSGVAVDGSGNVYVADTENQKIRKITPSGVVSSLAGRFKLGYSTVPYSNGGDSDGTGNDALFSYPTGVAVDVIGNVYVADRENGKIRKITPAGVVSTYAGTGSPGEIDSIDSLASFNYPRGVAVDGSGNVYVADAGNDKVRKIAVAHQLTGTPNMSHIGTHAVVLNSTDGKASSVQSFNVDVVVLPSVSLTTTHVNCGGSLDGRVDATVSGGIAPYTYLWSSSTDSALSSTDSIVNLAVGTYSVTITDNGGATSTASATVNQPRTLIVVDSIESFAGASDAGATISIIDGMMPYTYFWSNLDTASSITGIGAGTYSVTVTNGNGCTVKDSVTIVANIAPIFTSIPDTVVYAGNAYSYEVNTSDAESDSITHKAITVPSWLSFGSNAVVSTVAGSSISGSINGTGGSASFSSPAGVAVDGRGNVYVADQSNHKIRKVNSLGMVSTFVGSGSSGDIDGTSNFVSFSNPSRVAVDDDGNVYVADVSNHKIRKVTSLGVVSTIAGSGSAGSTDGKGSAASFDNPYGVAVDDSGNVYVADVVNHKIRKVNPLGVVSTLAGNGISGEIDSIGSFASFNFPSGVAVDARGNVYVADRGNHKIRKVTPSGVVSTLAGSGSVGSTDSIGSFASFNTPYGVAVDLSGNVYVGDRDNHQIRKITPLGMVSTLAGSGISGDIDSIGSFASFNSPSGVSVDSSGNVYVADQGNHQIRKIVVTQQLTGTPSTADIGTHAVVLNATDGKANRVQSFNVNVVALPSVILTTTHVSCGDSSDGRVDATVSGGIAPYTYLWSSSVDSALSSTDSIVNLAVGAYSITITDKNGKMDTASAKVSQLVFVSAAVVDSNISCNGLSDGGITASGTDGTSPYTYTWSNSDMTASITGLIADTYSVTITDNNGCTDTASTTVTEPLSLAASSAVDSNVTCNGLSDGGATVSGTGGTLPYTYAWSNSDITASITGLIADTYSVTITDNNGCTDTASTTVTEPKSIAASLVLDSNVTCNGLSDGGITASGTDGTSPYTYAWSNSDVTASITGLIAGTYSVTITDNNGCTDSASTTVTEPLSLAASSAVDSSVTCNGLSDGGATVSGTGGTSPYTYAWSNSDITASTTGLVAGTYSVTITDDNGCTDSASTTVTEPLSLAASSAVDSSVTCNGLSDGGATVSGTGGTLPYTYAWSNSDITASITGLIADTYTVTITDNNGCTDTASATVTEPIDTLNLTVTQNGFTLTSDQVGATYQWLDCSNGNTPIIGETSRSYTVTKNGDYAVIIRLSRCIDTSDCVNVLTTGIELVELRQSFRLYPNPTKNSFTIEVPVLAGYEMLQIYNLRGNLIREIQIQFSKENIALSNFTKGVYIVRYGDAVEKLVVIE